MVTPTSSALRAIAAALLMSAAGCAYASTFTVTRDGQPACAIVVPAGSPEVVRAAAEDLQLHIRLMSGAELPIAEEPAGASIVLGAECPTDAAIGDAADFQARVWPDGYLLAIEGDRLIVASPRPEGIANGVYGLLEDHLDCHWFTPGEIGAYVPKRRTVTVGLPQGPELVRPTYELRSPWYNGNAMPYSSKAEWEALTKWRTRNRGGGMRGYAGQDWASIFPKDLQEREPVLQAMLNGKREARGAEAQVCMASPRAVEIAVRYFVSTFTVHPELDYYTFSPNDNDAYCQCPDCTAMGSNPAARVLRFSNQVAEGVAAACPGKGITILPYSSTIEPPTEPMKGAVNLYPVICSYSMEQVKPKTDDHPWVAAYRDRVERWMEILPRAWSYDYKGWYPGPWTLFGNLQADEEYYRSIGFSGMMPEYLDRNLGTDTYQWLSYRISWDATQSVGGLLSRFYAAYFGPAAVTMRGVYEAFERQMLSVGGAGEVMEVPALYPRSLVEWALAQIAESKGKVAGDPVRLARIESDENCLRLTRLFLDFWDAYGAFRRSGGAEAQAKAIAAGDAYIALMDSLSGTLTVGSGARVGVVEPALKAMREPGTVFDRAGTFSYSDSLDDGGKSYHAKTMTGFTISTYGLSLAPNARGEIVYDIRAGEGLVFTEARLRNMFLTLPDGGHNGVDVSLDDGQTWTTAYRDTHMQGWIAEYDLTGQVAGARGFLLRFWVENGDTETLGMDNWGIEGMVAPTDSEPRG